MSGHQRESAYALVVLGNQGVGKSSLCLRYTTNEFPESHMETPWVDTWVFLISYLAFREIKNVAKNRNFFRNYFFSYDKHIDIGKSKKSRKRVHLRIYDTAGQEEMAALWESHLRNKDSGLISIFHSSKFLISILSSFGNFNFRPGERCPGRQILLIDRFIFAKTVQGKISKALHARVEDAHFARR